MPLHKHLQPVQEARRLVEVSVGHAPSDNLPPATRRRMQEQLEAGRWAKIEGACFLPDNTSSPFTLDELKRCKHEIKDTLQEQTKSPTP